ncbi:MAG: hypothetical protein LLF76_00115 [Planctomycetaceae bacterium]|nr:hypothetical protein [Planctomycetaceae bacterium]
MEPQEKIDFTIRYLLAKSLEGSITSEEIDHLNAMIIEYPMARRYYVEYLHIHVSLRKLLQKDPAAVSAMEDEILDDQLWQQLAVHEQTAESIETAPCMPVDATFLPVDPAASKNPARRVSRFTFITFAASLAALLVVIIFLNLPFLDPVEVATVTDSIKADYAADAIEKGSRLTNRKGRYYLQEGISSIQFDCGASVVIEAPAEFELKSADRMILFSGRLYASVPRQAIGFTVRTLDSTVIDLGTEFGMFAVPMQGTELHVFKGKTQMALPRSKAMLVTEGNAQRVETATGRIQAIALGEGNFVLKIDSKTNLVWKGREVISLSDLVLGGNGYGSSDKAVANFDPATGNAVPYLVGKYNKFASDYRSITGTPFLDGIFVPNGKNQVVSSKGHVFVDCPRTSGMSYHGLSFDKNCMYFPAIQDRYLANRRLDFDQSAIYMHANVGMTIDLNAVRQAFCGQTLCTFRTTVGTAFSSSAYGQFTSVQEAAPVYTEFDVWIVVDGQLRQKFKKVRWDSLIDIEVPIASTDGFLSILSTDAQTVLSDGNPPTHYDLCALADPRFEVRIME